MAGEERVERRLLVSVDARGYGRASGRMQGEIQRGLLKVLDEAAEKAGLRRETWHKQGAGDGELAVLPLNEPEVRVVERFPRELRDALRRLNRDRNDEARLRLRLAVHFGMAKPGPNGYQHPGPVVVSRLCDSEPLKRMLAASGADLVVVFSQQIHSDTIQAGLTLLGPAELRQVRVKVKEFDEDAWIWVPGYDVRDVDLGSAEVVWAAAELTAPEPKAPRPGGRSPAGATAHDVFDTVPASQTWVSRIDEED